MCWQLVEWSLNKFKNNLKNKNVLKKNYKTLYLRQFESEEIVKWNYFLERFEKLEKLKQQINSGIYEINVEEIAKVL